MTRTGNSRTCWCGNTEILPFGPDYGECRSCGTLVSQKGLSSTELLVNDDEHDFYGKQYWLDHQKDDLNFPDIHQRARKDLTERCLHWLQTLLKYRLPPAKVLELGSGHGGFVALMRQVGFTASGLELSPWVAEFAKEAFGVEMRVGPVETQAIEPGSLDVIVLMDVLEHLPDPVSTMRHCLALLRPHGLLLIQTPKFREMLSYEELLEKQDSFREMLVAKEHLYLFSERSAADLFRQLGAEYIYSEPAIFAQYDMFFVVSRQAREVNTTEVIEKTLLARPETRLVLGLLDLRDEKQELIDEKQELIARLGETEADRAVRLEHIHELTRLLKESEADRAARLVQIHELTRLLKEAEAERATWLGRVNKLTRPWWK